MAADANRCPTCGAERPVDAPEGVCPVCLMLPILAADSPGPANVDAAASAARTVRAAAIFETLPPREPFEWFELGCCHAALARMDGPGASPGERLDHADRAMDLLRKAAALGHRDPTNYRHDPGLDAVRQRPDFQLLMFDLAFPAQPFAR